MKELSTTEICKISGGGDEDGNTSVNIGNAVSAIAAGALIGGPVGLGYAFMRDRNINWDQWDNKSNKQ